MTVSKRKNNIVKKIFKKHASRKHYNKKVGFADIANIVDIFGDVSGAFKKKVRWIAKELQETIIDQGFTICESGIEANVLLDYNEVWTTMALHVSVVVNGDEGKRVTIKFRRGKQKAVATEILHSMQDGLCSKCSRLCFKEDSHIRYNREAFAEYYPEYTIEDLEVRCSVCRK
jgi:hypothetical protein